MVMGYGHDMSERRAIRQDYQIDPSLHSGL